MAAFITEVPKTSITKGNYGWTGKTYQKIKGFSYEITTMKRHGGEIVTSAQKLSSNSNDGHFTTVSFSMFQDKNITILRCAANATEGKIKELHFKALSMIDQMQDSFPQVPAYQIEPGQLFFMDGYGKENEKLAVYLISEEEDEIFYVNTKTLQLGQHELSTIRPWAEKFGIGYYYREGERMDMDQVSNLVIEAQAKAKRDEEERPSKEAASKAELERQIAEIEAQYPYLQKPDNEYGGGKLVAINLRIELKHAFPGVKFSVKSDYTTVDVSWTDGPSRSQVQEITDKWEDHKNDQSGDYRDYCPSLFNRVFGGCKYMSEHRDMSGETKEELLLWTKDMFLEGHTYGESSQENLAWKLFYEYEIPNGEWEIIPNGTCGSLEDIWKIAGKSVTPCESDVVHTLPLEVAVEVFVSRNLEKGGIEIRFKEKPSNILIEKLKAHSFRWSGFSKCWWVRYSDSQWSFANSIIIGTPV